MSDLTSAVLHLIRHYVDRQRLVDEFLRAVRPDFYMVGDEHVDLDTLLEAARRHGGYPQVGVWGDDGEWKHFIHGAGCKLTHAVTGEPIGWDTPDVQVFDQFWLANYLDWLASRDDVDSRFGALVTAYKASNLAAVDFLLPELNSLKAAKHLDQPDPKSWHHWRLLDHFEDTPR